jgi:hypothetical protein
MHARGFQGLSLALGALLALGAASPKARPSGPKLPKVSLKEVVESRCSGDLGLGPMDSALAVSLKLEGDGLDAYTSGRVLVKEARDDAGRSLLANDPEPPPFRDHGFGSLSLSVAAPPRAARAFSASGTVELFAPGRDPAAVVKVPNALRKLDVPLASPGLTAAKVQVTPLSKARHAEEQKKRSGEEAAARFRQQMKKDGIPDAQIDKMIEMRNELMKAFGSDDSEYSVVLAASPKDFERIQSVKFLGADGEETHSPSMSGGTDGITATRAYSFEKDPGPNVTIVFTLLTEKARLSVPFALRNVPLP